MPKTYGAKRWVNLSSGKPNTSRIYCWSFPPLFTKFQTLSCVYSGIRLVGNSRNWIACWKRGASAMTLTGPVASNGIIYSCSPSRSRRFLLLINERTFYVPHLRQTENRTKRRSRSRRRDASSSSGNGCTLKLAFYINVSYRQVSFGKQICLLPPYGFGDLDSVSYGWIR